MPEITPEMQIIIDAAVQKATSMQLVNHSAAIKDLKIASDAKIDALTADKDKAISEKLKASKTAEAATAALKAKDDADNAAALEAAFVKMEAIKPGFDREQYKSIESIDSYIKIREEVTAELNPDSGEEENTQINAPAVNGGNTSLPAEGHSAGKKKNKFGYKSHAEKQKELYKFLRA